MNETFLASLLALPVVLPMAGFLGLALAYFFGLKASDRVLEKIVRSIMFLAGSASLLLIWQTQIIHDHSITMHYGTWIRFQGRDYPFSLHLDTLSAVYLGMTMFLGSLVAMFSARYLRAEAGAGRFFACFCLFISGLDLLVLADSLDLLIVGWELLGLSSVFLIGFYWQRPGPVNNALAAFTVYRVADVGLLTAASLMIACFDSDVLPDFYSTALSGKQPLALYFGLLLTWAALGKSAQWPLGFWLPRAMEGPTPSSAIFYGALSIHAGAYLLLRTEPLWVALPPVRSTIIFFGLTTALYAIFVGRSRTDIKTALAYASMTQVGLIFIEIGLGWKTFALWHVAGHSMVRSYQFLKAPSALSDWLRFGKPKSDLSHPERYLPLGVRTWLYRRSLGAGNLETIMKVMIVAPLFRLATYCDLMKSKLSAKLEHHQDLQHPSTAQKTPESCSR